jgi:hypothetical protein
MKKILSIVFVGLFLLNSCGYYFILSYNQGLYREEMKNLIRTGYFSDQHEQFVITNPQGDPDFQWAEKGEFRYHGKLYDLISMDVKGSTIIVTGINDKKEEQLIAKHDQFRTLITGTNSTERAKNAHAIQNLVIKQALLRNFCIQPPANSSQVIFYDPVPDLKSIAITPSSPPPRSA